MITARELVAVDAFGLIVKDYQTDRVQNIYRWEREVWGTDNPQPKLSLKECANYVIGVVHAAYSLSRKPPRVLDGRGSQMARTGSSTMRLPKWARCKPVILHELAHWATKPNHEKEWLQTYVMYLCRYGNYPLDKIIESARRHGVVIY